MTNPELRYNKEDKPTAVALEENVISIDNIILDLYKLEDKLVYGDDSSSNNSAGENNTTIHPLDLADIIHSLAWRLNKYNTTRRLDEKDYDNSG
jgi:hypothetical protein